MARDRKKKRDRDRLLALKEKYPQWTKAHRPEDYDDLLEQGLVQMRGTREFRITSAGLESFHYRKWGEDEDKLLLELVGRKSNAEIAEIMGRPVGGVISAMKRLKVSNRRYGENHWNAKVDDLLVSMILTLSEAGYQPAEIANLVNQPRDIDRRYISGVVQCRTQNTRAQHVAQRCSTPTQNESTGA